MPIISLGRAFSASAAEQPDRLAVTCGAVSITRGELEKRSNRRARALASFGVKHGSFVSIGLPNSVEFYETVLAVWKLGAVPQPISPRLPAREREAIVELADSPVVLGAEPGAHGERVCLPIGWMPDASLSDELLDDDIAPSWKAPTSGGSTGRPKLIVDANPGVVDTDVPLSQGMQRDGSMVIPGPLYHNAPFTYSTRGLVYGNHIAILPKFDAEQTLQAIQDHQADWTLLVPTMMQRIWRLENRESFDMSSLKTVWHMASACPVWLKTSWIEWLGGEKIWELYAGTEAQAVTIIRGDEWMAHRGSVGRCLMGEMKILGADMEELPRCEVGEIYMRSTSATPTYRYLGAEAIVTADGWESLGDMGSIDTEGYIYLADRRKDMILSGGANLYPAEIESAIDEYPGVHSSAVIGLPDDDMGELPHGIIHAVEPVDIDGLRAFLGERLVRYKIPRTFEFVEFPVRDDAGKTRRSALRDERVQPV